MTLQKIRLAKEKAEEMKEGFPDGRVPVSSVEPYFDPIIGMRYYKFDISALTEKQRSFLIKLGREILAPLVLRDDQILTGALIRQQDTYCTICEAEPGGECKAHLFPDIDPEKRCPYRITMEEFAALACDDDEDEDDDENDDEYDPAFDV